MELHNPYEKYARLTEKESQFSYARYFFRPFPGISEEQENILKYGSRLTCKEALLPQNMSEMFWPEKIKTENGYCVMPDGTGFVAAIHQMPEVTLEMYRWWNEWRMKGDSNGRYKIWCPGKHLVCHNIFVSEEIGGKIEEIYFQTGITESPEKIGLDPEAMERSRLLLADGGGAWSKVVGEAPDVPPIGGIVIHFIYQHENGKGITMRSRFWKGFSIGEEGVYKSLAPDQKESMKSLRGLFEHNCIEMEYLNSLLPSLYKEECGKE